MGINNRKRRLQKQVQKKKRCKSKSENNTRSSAPIFQSLGNPLAGLSDEQRKEVIKSIAENSEKTYRETLERMREIITQYNPFILMASLASYGLTVSIGDKGIQKKDSEFSIHQFHLELLQALVLQTKVTDLGQLPFGPDVLQELWDLLTQHMSVHTFKTLDQFKNDMDDNKIAVNLLQTTIRTNTKSVRNWGYFSQVKNISLELYAEFNDDVKEKYGFTIDETVNTFKAIIDQIERKTTARYKILSALYEIKDIKELIYSYHNLINAPQELAEKFITEFQIEKADTQSIFFMVMAHYDLQLPEIYTFNKDSISVETGIENSTIEKIFNEFSYPLGALEQYKTDFIYLSNPIWSKPIIKIGKDEYFSILPQAFFSFIVPTLENLIEGIDRKALSDRRANYLEKKVSEIICRKFPESNTISAVKWHYNQTEYETDLITFIDSHVLIVEAKSGKITESALRGAPDRLKKHIKEILVEPNIQSKRLKERLLELISNPEIEDELREKLPVDLKKIHKIIRVSVTFDDFASIQANVSQLKKTGWLPEDFEPCPTMNLADFETLFDFLEHPVQIIHYLECRQEFEQKLGYMGDELDLMGFYIDTLFNIGDVDPNMNFILTESSAPIDAYYNSKDAGIIISKPKPKICPLFIDIFNQLEKRKTSRWTEIGVFLNRFSPNDQKKLMKMIERQKIIVQRTWHKKGHDNIIVFIPPKAEKYALCYVLYKNENSNQRDEFINAAISIGLEPEHAKQCLVIAKNIDDDKIPYHCIVLAQ